VQIKVKDGRGRRKAGGVGWRYIDGRCGYITMPKWSRYLFYVLHEITHVIMPHGVASHGREFARIFLQLVKWKMGKDTANELRAAYRFCGVKYVRISR
jgi:putative metallohydrolase (TIGR04338 family)